LTIPHYLRRRLLGISQQETQFSKRGFQARSIEIQHRLEQVGNTFVAGYHAALLDNQPDRLSQQLDNHHTPEFRGFAYEGAAMALALQDSLLPWRQNRLAQFLHQVGHPHIYMIHVGVGWAWARLPRVFSRDLTKLDPLLGWLAIDGYGFHEGYFHWPQTVSQHTIPHTIQGYQQQVFDQGLGRSLWFIYGADSERIIQTIKQFPQSRQADLYSGLGLAATYAGELDEASLSQLVEEASPFGPQLAQGAAFAAKARQRAGNLTPYTDCACQIFCGRTATAAAQVTDEALVDLPEGDAAQPAYALWRQRIQTTFAQEL